jgi:hypothetical protein
MRVAPTFSLVTRRSTSRIALLVVLATLASSAAATIWTRSTSFVPIKIGEVVPLKNAAYSTRDWTVSVRNVEAQQNPSPGPGLVSTTWAFGMANTDAEPHYVQVTIHYLDAQRRPRVNFTHRFKIDGGQKDDDRRGFEARCTTTQWQGLANARISIDFLSTPEG